MKLLFIAIFITYLLAVFDIAYFFYYAFKKEIYFIVMRLKDFILKILFPFLSLVFVTTLCIAIFKLNIAAFAGFIFINILLVFPAVLTITLAFFDRCALYLSIGIPFGIFAIVCLLMLGDSSIDENVTEKTITVPLYECSNSIDRESIFIKLTEEDDENENLYIAMEYDKNDTNEIELPLTLNEFSKCKLTIDSENKIVIIEKAITKITFYSYFGFYDSYNIDYEYEYYLYVNKACIENLGNN